MDEIALPDVFDWDPGRYGVTTAIVSTGTETLAAETHFFTCMTQIVLRFGAPRHPSPLPDLKSRNLESWAVKLGNGETVFGAFWMIECGWKSLQLDIQNDRVLYLVNHS